MPNRYFRASYIDSEPINNLSPEGERLFCRLVVHVDDFGRCEADPCLLLGKLFSRQLGRVTVEDVRRWLDECDAQNVVILYNVQGKNYLQINKWEQGRAKFSKYPALPTNVYTRLQLLTNAPFSDSDTDSDTDSDNIAGSRKRKRSAKPADNAWLESLRPGCKQQGVDLDGEVVRMKRWLSGPKGKGRKLTQQFVINWLNRCDKIVSTHGKHSASDARQLAKDKLIAQYKSDILNCQTRDEALKFIDKIHAELKDVVAEGWIMDTWIAKQSKIIEASNNSISGPKPAVGKGGRL